MPVRWQIPLIPALIASLGLLPSPSQAESWVIQVTETEEWIEESDPRFYEDDAASEFLYAEDFVDQPRLEYAIADRAISSFRARAPSAIAVGITSFDDCPKFTWSFG